MVVHKKHKQLSYIINILKCYDNYNLDPKHQSH